jgi:hypothetical protein
MPNPNVNLLRGEAIHTAAKAAGLIGHMITRSELEACLTRPSVARGSGLGARTIDNLVREGKIRGYWTVRATYPHRGGITFQPRETRDDPEMIVRA